MPDKSKAKALMAEWKKRFNLNWDIALKFKKNDEGFKDESVAYAVIKQYHRADLVIRADIPEKDYEETVIHELLHILIYDCFRVLYALLRDTESGKKVWEVCDEELTQTLETAFMDKSRR